MSFLKRIIYLSYSTFNTMKYADIGIWHHGCSGSKTAESFPDLKLEAIGIGGVVRINKNNVISKITYTAKCNDSKTLNEFLLSLKKDKNLKEINIINKKDNFAIISTSGVNKSSAYETILKTNCAVISPFRIEGGYERLTIANKNPKEVLKLINELKDIGQVKIFKTGNFNGDNLNCLSDKQFEALILAVDNDYYTWPRKINLTDLSKKLKINRRTLQERIRKAEAKTIPALFKKYNPTKL